MDQARKFYEEMGGKSIYPRIKMIGVEYNMNGNRKQNDVIANDFLIGKYPVTQKIWKTVMGNNPSKFKGCDNCPVESVSWYDAVEFCNKLSELHGLSKFYSIDKDRVDPNNKSEKDKKKWMIRTNENANGYRLPTETEWEFAARGGKLSKGYTYAGSNNLDEVGWYNKNSNKNIHPVGELKPNELGIYDMSGNVFEWCWDWYGEYNKADKDNPLGAESGNHRVVRGGSRNYYNINCRVAFRYFDNPDYRYFNLGFRLTRALHSNTFNERELAGE
ncbi:MAG: transcriptional regulator [Thalassobius sp.]|nr:transcriptional regulator [Thalassovita sp.]